jgi:hypothetical protein
MTTPILILALALSALQDGGVHPPSPVERMLESGSAPGGPEQDELVVIFQRVETRLREIDRLLYDASAGEPITSQAEGGITDLLRQTRGKNQEVLEDIDRILQIANERGQPKQGSSGSSGTSPGQSPPSPDGPPQGTPEESTQRESTPEGPGQERPQGERPDGDQPNEGQRPQDGTAPPGDGQTRVGDQPLRDPTGAGAEGGGDGRWGDLPVHVRELFRAQGGADLPPHYRDWIDAYYRRLNRDR